MVLEELFLSNGVLRMGYLVASYYGIS